MSKLPPALAARLAKRGLIQSKQSQPHTKIDEEEVIAEDYDDTAKVDLEIDNKIYDTVRGCPNKYNVYHNCSLYCIKKYSNISEEPPKNVKRKFVKLLQKYPINDSIWEQVYEPGLKTFYFWNTETDQVSWLPPSHPDAKISMPAEKLRKLLRDDNILANSDESDDEDNDEEEEYSEDSDSSLDSNDSEDKETFAKKRKQMVKRNELDPMDPAAYSNIPKGKWSDGL